MHLCICEGPTGWAAGRFHGQRMNECTNAHIHNSCGSATTYMRREAVPATVLRFLPAVHIRRGFSVKQGLAAGKSYN